jgi:hypothetical protein
MQCKLLAIPLAITVSACAAQAPNLTSTVQVPDKIKGAANESLAMIAAAKGVQIYECRASKDAGTADWVFVAPEAELFDTSGRKIGKHYAGPRWESSDGSTIAGTQKERIDAPQAGAIPWLLLTAKSVGPEGSFSKVTSVQRVSTVGGAAPKAGCSSASVGQVARMPYTADYYFLAARAGSASPYAAPVRGSEGPAGAY